MAQPTYSRSQLVKLAQQDAVKNGLGGWFVNQIQQESNFDPNAKSGAGAQGIAQFEPATAASVGLTNPYDPVASLAAAAGFDASLIKKYGSPQRALSAYNSGKPDAYQDPNFADGQTYNYVKTILGGSNPTPTSQPPSSPLIASVTPQPGSSAPVQPQVDYRPQLASQLAKAAGSQTNDLQAFYSTLHQAIQQRDQAPQDVSFNGTSKAQQVAAGLPRTQVGAGIAKTALTQIGTPYQYGGVAKLGSRTDCSGLLQASAAANGVKIGRTTFQQYKEGIPVPLDQLQPGDAVFSAGSDGTASNPGHVGIYIGNGRVVQDPHTGASVDIAQLGKFGAVGARRYG